MSELYNIKRENMLLLYHEKYLFIGVGAIGKEVIVPFFLKHGMYVTLRIEWLKTSYIKKQYKGMDYMNALNSADVIMIALRDEDLKGIAEML